jgi:Spy/CpxP family protein refolding chaperone
MNNRVRALESLIAVFLLGLLMGAGGALIWSHNGLPNGASWFSTGGNRNHFSEMLNLTPEQDTQMKAIFQDTRRQTAALRDEMEPKFAAIRAEANGKIAALLNDEQKKKFEQYLKERDSPRSHARGGNSPENRGQLPH